MARSYRAGSAVAVARRIGFAATISALAWALIWVGKPGLGLVGLVLLHVAWAPPFMVGLGDGSVAAMHAGVLGVLFSALIAWPLAPSAEIVGWIAFGHGLVFGVPVGLVTARLRGGDLTAARHAAPDRAARARIDAALADRIFRMAWGGSLIALLLAYAGGLALEGGLHGWLRAELEAQLAATGVVPRMEALYAGLPAATTIEGYFAAMIAAISALAPALAIVGLVMLMMLGFSLAQRHLERRGRLPGPRVELDAAYMPRWTVGLLAAAGVAAIWVPGPAGLVALNVALTLGAWLMVTGWQAWHRWAARRPAWLRIAALGGFYILLVSGIGGLIALPLVLALGIVDLWIRLRRPAAQPATPAAAPDIQETGP